MSDPVSLLLADEHVPDQVTFRLRKLGHDVVRVRDLCQDKGGDAMSDSEVFAFAISQRRTIITENCADFLSLHATNNSHFGIIASNQFSDWKMQAKEIDKAIKSELKRHSQLNGLVIRIPYQEHDPSRPVALKKPRRKGKH